MVVAPAPARLVRLLVPLAALAIALTLPAPSGADHVQTTPTGAPVSARFDHGGDNAWWVEVEVRAVTGQLQNVHAQVEGSATLQPMKAVANDATRQSQGWVKFAPQQAFHVPDGTRVRFWAGMTDGMNADTVISCWFTHPAGVEQCTSSTSSQTATGPPTTSSTSTSSTPTSSSSSTSSTSTPAPRPFDAAFTGVRGNEWWVQAQVATNGPAIVKVDVRQNVDGDWKAWQPVAKQSWGWGSSYPIAQGTIVQLRATASDGQTDLSSCRQWIPAPNADATIVSCPGQSSPPFQATYSRAGGNEWWAEVVITANQPVTAVGLRVDCQAEPEDMVYRADWGKWVLGNVRIPADSKVTFEANFDRAAASGGYIWPRATPTAGC